MAAAANDPGSASGVLAPPSCAVPSGTARRSSLRLPLSLPGSFASLAMFTRTDSYPFCFSASGITSASEKRPLSRSRAR